MKFLLTAILLISITAASAQNQSFFKPIPAPNGGFKFMGVSLASDSINNSFRPVASVTASFSSGASLAGGFGISFQHNKWDVPTQAWITQYSIAALGFLSTNGNSIGGIAGLVFGIPGTNGLINVGPGYDFTNKTWGFLSGVVFKFN